MRRYRLENLAALVVLTAMLALMWQPMKQETATNDEPALLAAGYSYWQGLGIRFEPSHPPLAKKLSALPLLFMDVKLSPATARCLDPRWGSGHAPAAPGEPATAGKRTPPRDNWYLLAAIETYTFGNMFLYDGANDADKLLFAGRLMQALLTLLTGVAIFVWARQLAGPLAALLGLVLWTFNPIALAYGHLVLTDNGATLTILLAVWALTRFLQQPTTGRAVLYGAATGGALLMKHTAVLLVPMSAAVAAVWWWQQPRAQRQLGAWGRGLPLAVIAGWIVLLLGYAPYWAPAPRLTPAVAALWPLPWWLDRFRLVLIPPDFFKGLALQLRHSTTGHVSYLCGQWRHTGWWYYHPLALAVKTPIPLLVLMLAGLVLYLKRCRQGAAALGAPWIAAAVYLAFAMTSPIDIGVRHSLPLIALVTVGVATQLGTARRPVQAGAWLLSAWLAVTALLAHPDYLKYFNEFAGGPHGGWHYLIDSNLDWGQDVKPLKQFLDEHHIGHVYQDYCGSNWVLDYYQIDNTRTPADDAKQLRAGILVVSVSRVLRPEWDWLRRAHRPLACVADTFLVYDLASAAATR